MKCYTIIPSGGSGKRAGTSVPKQYLQFNGKELIAYTLEVFQRSELIDEIIVAAGKDFFELIEAIKEKYSFTKLTKIVEGGEERQHSVFNALKTIRAEGDDLIIVHDAVRPFLSLDLLSRAIETAKNFGSVVAAIKAKDTLIKGSDSVLSYVDREEIFYVQTPQIFRYKIISDAMKKAAEENFIGTDESMLVHRAGYQVNIVNGSTLNFKITNQDDIKLFELIIEHRVFL